MDIFQTTALIARHNGLVHAAYRAGRRKGESHSTAQYRANIAGQQMASTEPRLRDFLQRGLV